MDTQTENCDKCGNFTRRILVTGGAGFIGSHVVILLVERYPQYFVVNLDKLDYCASLRHLDRIKGQPNYKFIQGDICEPDFMRYIFQEESIDVVLHFAAQTHVDVSFWSSLDFTRTNVYGTHVLINAAYEAGVGLFIHVSTDEVYGGKGIEAHKEDGKMHPTNPYSASKAAAECIVLSYYEAFSLPVIITRSNNVYGPHQYPEKVIPKFIARLLRDKKCCIHGHGEVVRNFLHVDDVASAFDVILHKGTAGEIYNVGSGDSGVSVADLAKMLIQKLKHVPSEDMDKYLEFVEDRPYNDKRYTMDSSKLHLLGWRPKVTWETGMAETKLETTKLIYGGDSSVRGDGGGRGCEVRADATYTIPEHKTCKNCWHSKVSWYKEEENFNSWPSSEAALTPYPPGSNTMRVGPYRRASTATGEENGCPKKRKRVEEGGGEER